VETSPAIGTAGDREPLPAPSSVTENTSRYGSSRRITVSTVVAFVPALVPAAIVIAIAVVLIKASGFHNFGPSFWGLTFNSNTGQFGMLVFIIGSFLTAVPALFLSMAIGLGIAIASTTYLPSIVSKFLDPTVDLLAGIPSVVYGIWAYLVLRPYFGMTLNPWTVAHFGWFPGLGAHNTFPVSPGSAGTGLPLAIVVLTLMALPITTLLMRDAFRSIPKDLWESGLALGATRWEIVRRVSFRQASRGIFSAAFLGFGRAIGETVAVAMVIGASDRLPVNFYDSTDTMAAFMYLGLDSAFSDPLFLSALAELAIVLLLITLTVNILGRRLVSHLYAQEVAGI
jgi:phosphate transport system permease protein